ncbi:MAG: hypothetical protein PQJ50_17195 [Spirochaetales bacterium]|nr:hypothetical protein [Spirochaetales bacterium]
MLQEMIDNGRIFTNQKKYNQYGPDYIDNPQYTEWKRKSLMFLQGNFPKHPQTRDFADLVNNDDYDSYESMFAILVAFNSIKNTTNVTDYLGNIERIFESFHRVSNQLKRRYNNRPTLKIDDEYDVQDLLHSLLVLYFDDIRSEDWVPQYAGGRTRVDFLLKNEMAIIETKMVNEHLDDKKIGDQLILDIAHYKSHPDCKSIICFVYDPEFRLYNPNGVEKDLEKLSDDNGVKVKIYIYPK